jgi:uncharacterized small protein (DUF1192 family)
MAVLDEAMDLRPADPMAWVTKVVTDRAGDREAVQRISDEWGWISIEDLDANSQRLMQREANQRAAGSSMITQDQALAGMSVEELDAAIAAEQAEIDAEAATSADYFPHEVNEPP